MANTSLTKPQLAAYWRAATAAARNLGEPLEDYRKRVMREECGADSVKELNRAGDFDKVMARFAVDAGDYAAAGHYATSDVRRRAVLVRICCAQIMQLKGEPEGSTAATDYLAGIVRQARFECGAVKGCFWLDCAPNSLMALFQILDTHRRRLLRGKAEASSIRCFMAFDPAVIYRPLSEGGVRIIYDANYYASYTRVKVNLQ